jgi:hypothetical protein
MIGRRIRPGATSVVNNAMPRLTGTAITIAMNDVSSVP